MTKGRQLIFFYQRKFRMGTGKCYMVKKGKRKSHTHWSTAFLGSSDRVRTRLFPEPHFSAVTLQKHFANSHIQENDTCSKFRLRV